MHAALPLSPPAPTTPPARFRSLKWRLTTATLLAFTLALLALGAALLGRAERDTLSAQRRDELTAVTQAAAVLSRRVVEHQRALQVVAAQLDPATLADDTRLFQFVAGKPVLLAMFHNLAVTGTDGHARVRHDARGLQRSALYLGDLDQFRQTLTEQRPLISPPLASRVTGEPIVVLSQPLKHAGGVHGALFGTLTLAKRELLGELVQLQSDGARALLIVTDSNGLILVHPDPARLLKKLADEPRFTQAHAQWVSAGRPVEPGGLAFEQAGQLVSAAGVAGPDWVVWRALPEAELLAPLLAARSHALAWGGGVLIGMALLTWLLITLELKPLATLERRAKQLFDATLAPGAGWPEAGGEIGSLAAVLKQAAIDRAELEACNRQALRKLEWSATHDALTGLVNREAFDARLAQLFAQVDGLDARDRPPAALIAIDLDHFKPVNDDAGHAAGDEVLRAVAGAIASRVRAGDLVARTGGDEFTVLLEPCAPEGAARAAEEIRQAILQLAVPWQGRVLQVGASVGVTLLTPAIANADHWKQAADAACYAAKAAGRAARAEPPRLVLFR
ncbi:diguanylate cyclase [Aquincola sp. S2]|uniref:diguanylate cyclase n=1 Tax=Pseudaquabacterium terrae TaxID=2732868 RepID=A0ABX2ET61_9BURK|nr:diguanylate cyclase [Aquabacterium terrae]NRF71823.1 diguanylate cyclase [Aquabacterium terrae]